MTRLLLREHLVRSRLARRFVVSLTSRGEKIVIEATKGQVVEFLTVLTASIAEPIRRVHHVQKVSCHAGVAVDEVVGVLLLSQERMGSLKCKALLTSG